MFFIVLDLRLTRLEYSGTPFFVYMLCKYCVFLLFSGYFLLYFRYNFHISKKPSAMPVPIVMMDESDKAFFFGSGLRNMSFHRMFIC